MKLITKLLVVSLLTAFVAFAAEKDAKKETGVKPGSALGLLLFAVVVAATTGMCRAEGYEQTVARARAERLARLKDSDGWLTLVGLDFLRPGENTVGAYQTNNIVLARG